MLKKYLGDIAFMQVLNLLVKPIWILVIDRAVQESLPLNVYGNYTAVLGFSLMFFIILDLGLNSYNTTQVSRDQGKIASLSGNIIGLKILLSIVYVLIAILVGLMLGYESKEFSLLLFILPLQIITSMNQYLRSIVNGLQKFKWDGVFMVLDRVLIIVLCSILIWGGIEGWELTIDRFVYAQLIGIGVVLFSLIYFLRDHLTKIKLSFNLTKIIPILKKSWPFALMITLMGLFNYVDTVMLKFLKGDAETGVYALGYRLYYALLMFAQIFSGVLLAFFSKNMKDKQVIDTIASYTIKLLYLVGITAAAISMAYNQEVMDLLYPTKSSEEAANAFSILMTGFLGSALVLVFGTLLTAALELKYLNIAAFVTLTINLTLNSQLIPIYGAKGAAIATLISQVIFGGICYIVSVKKFKFRLVASSVLRHLFGTILLAAVILLGKQYFDQPIVHLTMITLTVILTAYFYRLFKVDQLKSLRRK